MSFGLYSPIKLRTEPFLPTLALLTAVIMSFSFRPALSAGLSFMMAE